MADDSGGPVPLSTSGGPGLEGANVGRLVSAVVVEQIFLSLLVEQRPHLATILRGDGDLEVLVLHDPHINVLGLSVAGPLVLSQVGQLRTAHISHGALENIVTATIIRSEHLRCATATANFHTDGTTLNRALLKQEVGEQVSRQGITVKDVHLGLLNLHSGSHGTESHSGHSEFAHRRHFNATCLRQSAVFQRSAGC